MMSFDTKKIKSKHDRCKLWDVNSTYTYGILKNTSCSWSSSKYVSVFCVPKKVKCDVSVITVHLTNEMEVNFYNMLIAFNNIQGINIVNKQHQCLLCEYKAVKKDNLQRHTNSIHKDQKFQCPLCEYKAAWKANLQRHIKSVHEGQNFQCPHCEYKATWKTDLHKHIKSHEDQKFQCPHCKKKATRKTHLQTHIKSVNE